MNLRAYRTALGISQSKLSRISCVSRFKICTFELGSGSLTTDERERITRTLQAEAIRLSRMLTEIPLAGDDTDGA